MKAIVFSGGGMMGAYQVGVWKVLSPIYDPDLVVGASIGSINAWMVAGGCGAEVLENLWMDGDELARASWRFPVKLSHGLLDPAAAHAVMQRLCLDVRPKLKIAVVARRLPALKAVTFVDNEITWRHLAASCAIPLIYDPQRIGNRWYTDGGLVEPLPLFAARALGATKIIGVNCMIWGGRGRGAAQVIQSKRLWSPKKLLRWNRDTVRGWIALGEKDALESIKTFAPGMF